MCGICGFVSKRDITQAQLTAMNDTMRERGPDDAGVERRALPRGRTLGLAQRRLSILDLSSLGHQPMSTPDGRLHLVYNGEIYNYQALRAELPEYVFRSNCDTEVILAAYLRWGVDCFTRFNGMFAIALYDERTGELVLSRDRAGQKPLYYWMDGEDIVFASVLAPIMTCPGFPKRIRRDVLPRYLYQEYIHAPDTIFENVYQVEPGTVAVYRLPGGPEPDGVPSASARMERMSGGLRAMVYWDTADRYRCMREEPVSDYEEAKAGLLQRLQASVKCRMLADVPLGTFLSGGYDSSLITALAQEQLGSTPLRTFSVGFQDAAYDESPYARQVAGHLGTDHTEMIISEKDMLELVSDLPAYYDEPMADSSQIPTMLVAKAARQRVTVALSGDAGDEFYCGYGIYDRVRQAQRLDRAGAAAHLLGALPAGGGKRLEDHYPFLIRVISANRNPLTKTQFGEGSYAARARALVRPAEADGVDARAFLTVNYEFEDRYPSDNWQVRRMLLDMDTYLPDDILTKVDRASMKYSLESRCPFLDPEVMEYSFRIDHALKYHRDGRRWSKKYILKCLAYDYIPRELLERPKKGFSVPLSDWLRGPLRAQLLRYADASFLQRQGLFDAANVRALVTDFLAGGDAGAGTGRNYSRLVWSYYVFQQWAEYWNVCT